MGAELLQELVEAALDGYCVTIFAFGQTGSGKTHTMIGPRLSRGVEGAATSVTGAGAAAMAVDSEDGILARCLQHAYSAIAARAGQVRGRGLRGPPAPGAACWLLVRHV